MPLDSFEAIYREIASVNASCYPKIKENVFFLEQVSNKNLVKVMQEIRDAYDHLHHIYRHEDHFSEPAASEIRGEFEKFRGHMQRLAIETVRKVADYYIKLIETFFSGAGRQSEWIVVKTQIARKVKEARDREASGDFEARYATWVAILGYTDAIIEKYDILPGSLGNP